jgi:hypothetical protein
MQAIDDEKKLQGSPRLPFHFQCFNRPSSTEKFLKSGRMSLINHRNEGYHVGVAALWISGGMICGYAFLKRMLHVFSIE